MSRRPTSSVSVMLAACLAVSCYDLEFAPFQHDTEGPRVEWAEKLGGAGEDHAIVDAFPNGDIVTAGFFRGVAIFGEGDPSSVVLDSGVGGDGKPLKNGFLALYGPAGAFRWVLPVAADGEVLVNGLAAVGDGDSVVTGEFESSLVFAGGTSASVELHAGKTRNMVLARVDHHGTLRWATAEEGLSVSGQAVAASPDHGVVVAGRLVGAGTFGEGSGSVEITPVGQKESQAFVAAYDGLGNLSWVRATRGDAGSADVSVAGATAYVAGWFRGETTFGAGEPGETKLTSVGGADVFIAAHDLESGALHWAASLGGGGDDAPCALALDGGASLVIAGAFEGSAQFGAASRTSAGDKDVFVARFALGPALAGNPEWVATAGGAKADGCTDVAWVDGGSVLVSGGFSSEIDVGEGDRRVTLTSGGFQDGFVAQYDGSGALLAALGLGGPGVRDSVWRVAAPHPKSVVLSGGFEGKLMQSSGADQQLVLTSDAASDLDAFLLRLELAPSGK